MLHQLSLSVEAIKANEKWLNIVASTSQEDAYGTRVTKDFFQNAIRRALMGYVGIPEWLRERVTTSVWKGGNPFVTPSHLYPQKPEGILGYVTEMRVEDKEDGVSSLFALALPNADNPYWEKVEKQARGGLGASLAFVDLAHRHPDGTVFFRNSPDSECLLCENGETKKEFLDGVILHIGLTLHPATPGTSVELRSSSNDDAVQTAIIKDAASVLGVSEEEIKALVQDGVFSLVPHLEVRCDDDGCLHYDGEEDMDDFVEDALYGFEEEEKSFLDQLEDVEEDIQEETELRARTAKILKKEPDGYHPADHYLVAEDLEKPSTWHLPVKNVKGEYDRRRLGAAWAALTVGFRGRKYRGPYREEALRKLRRIYQELGIPIPDTTRIVNARLDVLGNKVVEVSRAVDAMSTIVPPIGTKLGSLEEEVVHVKDLIAQLQRELRVVAEAISALQTTDVRLSAVQQRSVSNPVTSDPIRQAARWLMGL